MKKLVTLIAVVVMTLVTAVAPVSAATAGYGSSDGYQIKTVNGCTVMFYNTGTHPAAAQNDNGRVVSYCLWVSAPHDYQNRIIEVLGQDVVINPTHSNNGQFTWVNPVIGLCGTEGLEFVSSRYEPSNSTVGGGYLTLDFITTDIADNN